MMFRAVSLTGASLLDIPLPLPRELDKMTGQLWGGGCYISDWQILDLCWDVSVLDYPEMDRCGDENSGSRAWDFFSYRAGLGWCSSPMPMKATIQCIL